MRRTGERPSLAVLLLPVMVTVLLAAAVGGFVVVENAQQSDQLEEADAVGADYLSAVVSFRSKVLVAIKDADQDDPAAIRAALVEAIEDPPQLPDADGFGARNSSTYAEAEAISQNLLDPYTELSDQLAEAEVSFTYIEAAREVLDLRVEDFVEGTLLSSSASLRNALIPRFVQARDELAQVPAPDDAEDVAATVAGAVQHVIDEATTLANSSDANQNYTFTYAAEYQAAITALENYATGVEGDLTESLNAVADLSS